MFFVFLTFVSQTVIFSLSHFFKRETSLHTPFSIQANWCCHPASARSCAFLLSLSKWHFFPCHDLHLVLTQIPNFFFNCWVTMRDFLWLIYYRLFPFFPLLKDDRRGWNFWRENEDYRYFLNVTKRVTHRTFWNWIEQKQQRLSFTMEKWWERMKGVSHYFFHAYHRVLKLKNTSGCKLYYAKIWICLSTKGTNIFLDFDQSLSQNQGKKSLTLNFADTLFTKFHFIKYRI